MNMFITLLLPGMENVILKHIIFGFELHMKAEWRLENNPVIIKANPNSQHLANESLSCGSLQTLRHGIQTQQGI